MSHVWENGGLSGGKALWLGREVLNVGSQIWSFLTSDSSGTTFRSMAPYADSESSPDRRWQTRFKCASTETGGRSSGPLWYLDAEYSNSSGPRHRHEACRRSLSALGREDLSGTRTRGQGKR